eukprot:TRINITY_DN3908_c0_g1_i2.p2 TRINITY_DN3908_c0_g1~~TRINITY_DN3908_c0_g1_i2.p2  ORF type:complete len:177 (-),score=11.38 TRINITY_DN3908_c0_g1_i2:286-816(-)
MLIRLQLLQEKEKRLFYFLNGSIVNYLMPLPLNMCQDYRDINIWTVVYKIGNYFEISTQAPMTGYSIKKNSMDAFSDKRLDPYLQDEEIQGVIISGVETQDCCLHTARSAAEKGYDVVMLSDGTASSNESDHEKALNEVSQFGRIMTCAEAVEGYYLVGEKEIKILRGQKTPPQTA